jgi:23S rRNA (uracil1939-C5)-methyltransferase
MTASRRGTARRKKPLPEGEFEAQIVDLAEDGRGVARVDGGKVCFIHGALPGETVRFRYTRVHKDLDEGDVTAVLQPSPDRVTPPCPHFGVCGGCSLQHLSGAAQIALKQKQVLDALRRVGKVEPDRVVAPITGPTLGYRRRARLGAKFVDKRGTALVGFRERNAPFLAALDTCAVIDPRVGEKLRVLGEAIAGLSIRRLVPQIEIACADAAPAKPGRQDARLDGAPASPHGGAVTASPAAPVALVLRTLEPATEDDRMLLRQLAQQHGFDLYLQTKGPDSIEALDPPPALLDYSPDGSADRLQFQPTDFIQINAAVSQNRTSASACWSCSADWAIFRSRWPGAGRA